MTAVLHILILITSVGLLWWAARLVNSAVEYLTQANTMIKFLLGRLRERQQEIAALKQILISEHGYDEEDLEWFPETGPGGDA